MPNAIGLIPKKNMKNTRVLMEKESHSNAHSQLLARILWTKWIKPNWEMDVGIVTGNKRPY
jgi:hypothetical protein